MASSSAKSLLKSLLKLLLKLGLTAGGLYLVFRRIDAPAVGQAVRTAQPAWLLAALLAFVASKWLAAKRLNQFFHRIGVPLSEADNLRLYWLGMFYNLFLPGGIGGDGYKVYLLHRRYQAPTRPLLGAVLLDRVSGVAALLVLADVFFVLTPYPLPYKPALLGLIPVLIVVYFGVVRRFFKDFAPILVRTSWQALLVQVAQVGCAACLLLALHAPGAYLPYLLIFLVSSVVAVLPLTIGGVGARELTFLLGAQLLHISLPVAVALSLVFYLLSALTALPGAFFQLKIKS